MKNQQGRRGGAKASAKVRGKVGAKASAALATAQLEPLGVAPNVAFGMIGVGVTKGYELIAAGELQSYRIGRARRITIDSIKAFVAKRVTEAEAGSAPKAA